MLEKYLWIAGSSVFLILGMLHLLYTFFTNKFSSRNTMLINEMKSSVPILTKRTTMWKAWVGFNASHSIGAIYIGFTNIYIAALYTVILGNTLFLCFNIVIVLFYLWLAKKYWFSTPFKGILITCLCFMAALIITLSK